MPALTYKDLMLSVDSISLAEPKVELFTPEPLSEEPVLNLDNEDVFPYKKKLKVTYHLNQVMVSVVVLRFLMTLENQVMIFQMRV